MMTICLLVALLGGEKKGLGERSLITCEAK